MESKKLLSKKKSSRRDRNKKTRCKLMRLQVEKIQILLALSFDCVFLSNESLDHPSSRTCIITMNHEFLSASFKKMAKKKLISPILRKTLGHEYVLNQNRETQFIIFYVTSHLSSKPEIDTIGLQLF